MLPLGLCGLLSVDLVTSLPLQVVRVPIISHNINQPLIKSRH